MGEGAKVAKRRVWNILFYTVLILAAIGIIYSTFYYKQQAKSAGVIFCADEECNIAMHIHADIEVQVCGKIINFPLEKGGHKDQHTHKERNKIHWEGVAPINPETKELLRPGDFSINEFFKQMEFELPEDCSGKQASLNVVVNNIEKSEKLDYSWKDGDNIAVKFE